MRLQATLSCAIWFSSVTGYSHAQACEATPEAAAQSVVGTPLPRTGMPAAAGFRVQDMQIDPVLHRVWFRVARCDDARAPLVLVPLRASLAGASQPALLPLSIETPKKLGDPPALAFVAPAPRVLAVHSGDTVTVVFHSADVHMELDGTADQQASIGDGIAVTLRRRGDEPAHRMHGVLRADHRVEVTQ